MSLMDIRSGEKAHDKLYPIETRTTRIYDRLICVCVMMMMDRNQYIATLCACVCVWEFFKGHSFKQYGVQERTIVLQRWTRCVLWVHIV
jgi:hypothetical protein